MKNKIAITSSKESFFNTDLAIRKQMMEYVTLSDYGNARKLACKNPKLIFHKLDFNSDSPLQQAFSHYDTRMWKIFLSVLEQQKISDYKKIVTEQYEEIKEKCLNLDELFESYKLDDIENDELYRTLAKNQKQLPAWMTLRFCEEAENVWGIDFSISLMNADPVNLLVANQFISNEEYSLSDVDFYDSIGVDNILIRGKDFGRGGWCELGVGLQLIKDELTYDASTFNKLYISSKSELENQIEILKMEQSAYENALEINFSGSQTNLSKNMF